MWISKAEWEELIEENEKLNEFKDLLIDTRRDGVRYSSYFDCYILTSQRCIELTEKANKAERESKKYQELRDESKVCYERELLRYKQLYLDEFQKRMEMAEMLDRQEMAKLRK